jgi:Ca2+-binding RTX toxin-like protein
LAFVENLTLTGTSALAGTGNALDNVLTGNSGVNVLTGLAGNDTLNGGAGADTMVGGVGNDTYVVDNAGDVVTELDGEGTDTVQSSLSFSLAALAFVENLTLTGTSALAGTGNALDNVLTGNSGANALTGLAGNDMLNGGTGADTMMGGLGNDTYVVDNAGDVVTENANEGIDTVQAAVTHTLAGNVENLTLTGNGNINGTGNALDNVIVGNGGNNILAGLGGSDALDGGTGTDTASYAASPSAVTVSLAAGTSSGGDAEGDTLISIENLTGSGLNDTLEGNGANNTLNGGAGTDTVSYEHAGAAVTVSLAVGAAQNTGGAGTDTLSSFENLMGSAFDDALTGSSVANVLMGLAGNDTLNGGGGADALVGGAGNDIMNGNGGSDTFVFAPNFGNDTINDFDANPSGGQDFLDISEFGITSTDFAARVAIADVGADTLVTIDGNLGQTSLLVGIGNATTVTQADFLLA